MRARVHIPSPLFDYTDGRKTVNATGTDLAELIADLDRQFEGLGFRIVDEQGRVRPHIKVFLNGVANDDLATAVEADAEVHLVAALSGG